MKRFIKVTLIILCVCIIWFNLISPIVKRVLPCTYLNVATIIEIDKSDDCVYAEDNNGEVWAFYGAESQILGNKVNLLMNNNATSNIYDDYIVEVFCLIP